MAKPIFSGRRDTMTGPTVIDMATVHRRKREMVENQIAIHLQYYKESGAELIMGDGRFTAPKTLEVSLNDGGTRVLTGDRVFLNVGTHAAIPTVPGLEAARPLTHIEALELDYLPSHLIASLRQRSDNHRIRPSASGPRGYRRLA